MNLKCALKTHPDKPGGSEREFRRVSDAYGRLMQHAASLEAIELEAELSQAREEKEKKTTEHFTKKNC